jgi:hypothetical protein
LNLQSPPLLSPLQAKTDFLVQANVCPASQVPFAERDDAQKAECSKWFAKLEWFLALKRANYDEKILLAAPPPPVASGGGSGGGGGGGAASGGGGAGSGAGAGAGDANKRKSWLQIAGDDDDAEMEALREMEAAEEAAMQRAETKRRKLATAGDGTRPATPPAPGPPPPVSVANAPPAAAMAATAAPAPTLAAAPVPEIDESEEAAMIAAMMDGLDEEALGM